MNSSKTIDISKSSLIGLKAELLKKQEEVQLIKETQGDRPKAKSKKTSGPQKSNKGVEVRSLKDKNTTEDEDCDTLIKSRQLLEAKSRLYNKLKANKGASEVKDQYLIDFDLKQEIYSGSKVQEVKDDTSPVSDDEGAYSDTNSDPENDWVDFVDTLGRSRRCLRKDLSEMKAKDASLAASLRPPSPTPAPEVTPELLSWDMQREMMRRKWEEQENLLLNKKDIHYQDVLFDEARPHGVGYYGFSTDEAERMRQQQELKDIRKQTVEQQEAALGLKLRRQQQLEARLAAAHRRKRERLGLPPDEPAVPEEAEVAVPNATEEEQNKTEKVEDLEESIKKLAPVRPWDIGKEGARPVMTQEEWVEKKRSERPQEFAPPSSFLGSTENTAMPSFKKKKNSKYVKHKLHKHDNPESGQIGPLPATHQTHASHDSTTSVPPEIFCSRVTEISQEEITCSNRLESEKGYQNNAKSISSNVCNVNIYMPFEDNNMSSKTEKTPFCPDKTQNKYLNKSLVSTFKNSKNIIINEIDESDKMDEIINPKSTNVGAEGEVGSTSDINKDSASHQRCTVKRKWAEIAPPACMAYYNNCTASSVVRQSSSKSNISESISFGLNFLKSKEEKTSRVKGLLDMI